MESLVANAKGMRSNQTGILRCLLLPFLLTTSSLTTIPGALPVTVCLQGEPSRPDRL